LFFPSIKRYKTRMKILVFGGFFNITLALSLVKGFSIYGIAQENLKNVALENKNLKDSISKLNDEIAFNLKSNKFLKKKLDDKVDERDNNAVSFMKIDKAPTFPGCEEGDKVCFSKGVQKHFGKYFDVDLPNQLGLESGRKRVFIGFTIDKEGNIVDIKARAPHPAIKAEVIRVMSSLPKVAPGEQDGKKVSVKYSIPFVIVIDDVKK